MLVAFSARNRRGDLVRIGDIIDGAKLPLKAKWFTGVVQLPIGEFDYGRQLWPVLVEVVIEKGKVTKISAVENAAETYTWNGLRHRSEKGAKGESSEPKGS